MPFCAMAFSSIVSVSWNLMLSAFRFYSTHILTILLTMVVSKMVRIMLPKAEAHRPFQAMKQQVETLSI